MRTVQACLLAPYGPPPAITPAIEEVVTIAPGAPRATIDGTNERKVLATPKTFTLNVNNQSAAVALNAL